MRLLVYDSGAEALMGLVGFRVQGLGSNPIPKQGDGHTVAQLTTPPLRSSSLTCEEHGPTNDWDKEVASFADEFERSLEVEQGVNVLRRHM